MSQANVPSFPGNVPAISIPYLSPYHFFIRSLGLGPTLSVLILGLIYFYSMYIFSSLSGHILAFVGPFMSAGKALGGDDYLITAILCYFSTLSGCLTNFSSGPIVIYYS